MSDTLDLGALRALVDGFRGRFFWQEGHSLDRGIGDVADYTDCDDALVYVAEPDDHGDLTRDDVYVIGDEVERHVGEPLAAILNAAPALLSRLEDAEGKAALLDSLVAHCDPDGNIPRDVLVNDVARVLARASRAFINERRAHERIHALAEGVADLASEVAAEGKTALAARLRSLLSGDGR